MIKKGTIFLVLCSILSAIGVMMVVIDQPDSGDLGYVAFFLYPLVVFGFPARSVYQALAHFLFYETGTSIWYAVSLVRMLPIAVVSLYAFSFFLFCRISFLFYMEQMLPKEERKKNIVREVKIFILCFACFFVLASAYSFVSKPTAPFLPPEKLLQECIADKTGECTTAALQSIIPDCSGKTRLFLFPLRIDLPRADNCQLDRLISEHPLATYHNVSAFSVLSFFEQALHYRSDKEKTEYCKSFYDIPGIVDTCKIELGVLPEITNETSDSPTATSEESEAYCVRALLQKVVESGNKLQQSCISKLLFSPLTLHTDYLMPGKSKVFGYLYAGRPIQYTASKISEKLQDINRTQIIDVRYGGGDGSYTIEQGLAESAIEKIARLDKSTLLLSVEDGVGVVHPISPLPTDEPVGDFIWDYYERAQLQKLPLENINVYLETVRWYRHGRVNGEKFEDHDDFYQFNLYFKSSNVFVKISEYPPRLSRITATTSKRTEAILEVAKALLTP